MKQAEQYQKTCAVLADLTRKRLGVRGRQPEQILSASLTRLPKHLRPEAQHLARSLKMAEHPRLRLLLDYNALSQKTAEMQRYLRAVNRMDSIRTSLLDWATGIAFNLLILLVILFALLRWRGLI